MKWNLTKPWSNADRTSRARRVRVGGSAAAVSCLLALVSAGCTDEDEETVVTLETVSLQTLEDEPLDGAVSMADGEAYILRQPPATGALTLDPSTGVFSFVPNRDYFGEASFAYTVRNAGGWSRGVVSITVMPVNDPPELAGVGDVSNSAESFVLDVQLDAQDVDDEQLRFTASTEDSDVAGFELDERTGKLGIFPRREGVAVFRVSASDDEYSDEEEFRFVVGRVTRRDVLPAESLAEETVEVRNPLEEPMEFRLNVNDRLFPGSAADILDRLTELPVAPTEDPSIPRSVWTGLVSSISRGYTLTERQWLHDPVILLNSVGAAYCDDFASAFYALMRQAGYQARVWTLNGHVVPEVFDDDDWRLYDPDLGVYYTRSDGAIAGVEDLVASPDLITSPLGGEFLIERVADSAPYSEVVADIYTSTTDNLVWDYYMTPPTARTFEFVLPPGGTLSFPGGWKAPPADVTGRPAPGYANLKVTVPGGWSGSFAMPLVLLDVKGLGIIKIGASEFAVGSAELEARLRDRTRFIEGLSIERADTDLELIYMINPRIISDDNSYLVELEGVQVAALRLERAVLEPEYSLVN